jgi:spectinomycin phosphotransferase
MSAVARWPGDGLGVEPVTHGDRHPANVMSVAGRLILIDWDTAGLAPPSAACGSSPQRGHEANRHYEAIGHVLDPAVMAVMGRLRLRWYLDDIAHSIGLFRVPRHRAPDTQRGWDNFTPRMEGLDSWQKALTC